MKSTFDELKDLIDYIQSVYTEITIVSLEQSSAAHSWDRCSTSRFLGNEIISSTTDREWTIKLFY